MKVLALSFLFPLMGVSFLNFITPMNLLLCLLFVMWTFLLVSLMVNTEVWCLIYFIMILNGGLMVVYLFIIAMIPKERKLNNDSMMNFKYMMILMFFGMGNINLNNMFLHVFNTSNWFLILLMIFIFLFSLFIFFLMIDPFKTMKSAL